MSRKPQEDTKTRTERLQAILPDPRASHQPARKSCRPF